MIHNPFVFYPEISTLSEETIYRMLLSEGYNFRCYVAANINTPTKILDRLSHDKDWVVRNGVAYNPNTKSETLDRLSYDKDYWVRGCVAINPNTSPETLDRLSYDKSYNVRWKVARNPNIPQYIKDLYKFKEYLKYYG